MTRQKGHMGWGGGGGACTVCSPILHVQSYYRIGHEGHRRTKKVWHCDCRDGKAMHDKTGKTLHCRTRREGQKGKNCRTRQEGYRRARQVDTEEKDGRTRQEGFRGKVIEGTVGKTRKDAGDRKTPTEQDKKYA
jgi:hypothetical protein